MSTNNKKLEEQLSKSIELGKKARSKIDADGYGDLTINRSFLTSARAVVHQIAGNNSTYHQSLEEIMSKDWFDRDKVEPILGVLNSLFEDFNSGYLSSYSELIHGELFANFLEMAEHLINEGYKDAATVIAGSTLEEHLRQLCIKHTLDIETTNAKVDTIPKKADKINADLKAAGVYNAIDHKSVTTWLGLRNSAAHGKYSDYSKEQIQLMISGITDFISRNPA